MDAAVAGVAVGAELQDAIAGASRFGADPAGGVTRGAWSPELFALYDELGEQARLLGLTSRVDEAGNLLLRWEVGTGQAVAIGSHLDTVPNGGSYDGTLGVLAGLEAVRRLRRDGFVPAQPVWIVAFMDEEGARFGTSLFGSRAFVGEPLDGLADRSDGAGISLREAMSEAGFAFEAVDAARRVGELGCYLELHIEQGPVLESAALDLGIVTGICGIAGFRVGLAGEAGHAGTVPSDMRRDALVGAARVVLAVHDFANRAGGDVRATVGMLDVRSGAANVIPGDVELSVDVRAGTADALDAAADWLRDTVAAIADEGALVVEIQQTHRADPIAMDASLIEALEEAAIATGARTGRLVSGAGHDAMVLAPHVPAGMLFVPSDGGVSHTPQENTSATHCDGGTEALVAAIRRLDGRFER